MLDLEIENVFVVGQPITSQTFVGYAAALGSIAAANVVAQVRLHVADSVPKDKVRYLVPAAGFAHETHVGGTHSQVSSEHRHQATSRIKRSN